MAFLREVDRIDSEGCEYLVVSGGQLRRQEVLRACAE